MCSALECKILCGKKWLEDADKTESRATFRNEIHFVLVRTVEGWNFVQRLWPRIKINTTVLKQHLTNYVNGR